VTLLLRRGAPCDGRNPLLLHGYGAYGASVEPVFNGTVLPLVDRGFIYAIAHVRGGQELGRGWYDAGRMLHKRNTFEDFIAVAEELVRRGYTRPDRLTAQGASAGGLLMGVVANERPDLFRALVADVPFVDVVNTMLDPSLPLTAQEWEQWGNPARLEEYHYLRGYSPYDNVRPQAYPWMLVTAALHDSQVMYWEPAKWVARLRATATGPAPLLLQTHLAGGHVGPSDRYARLREAAFRFAFLLDAVGLAAAPTP
ncbi:MAG TPA: prolyl oligopeptidase family serine peptidase, partial [Gemmatimonadales bacterium]|nr:prolyl oligopeptidase family serine peptidase [Gemmatimonadales bacterium]